jgi:hypothetical protein
MGGTSRGPRNRFKRNLLKALIISLPLLINQIGRMPETRVFSVDQVHDDGVI